MADDKRLDEQFPWEEGPLQERLQGFTRAVEQRLTKLDKESATRTQVINDVVAFALTRINEVLLPAYEQIDSLLDRGFGSEKLQDAGAFGRTILQQPTRAAVKEQLAYAVADVANAASTTYVAQTIAAAIATVGQNLDQALATKEPLLGFTPQRALGYTPQRELGFEPQRALGFTPVRQGDGSGTLSLKSESNGHVSVRVNDFNRGSILDTSNSPGAMLFPGGNPATYQQFPSGMLMQMASTVVMTDGAGRARIIFPVAYRQFRPMVLMQNGGLDALPDPNGVKIASSDDINLSYFDVTCISANVGIRVNWQAMGTV